MKCSMGIWQTQGFFDQGHDHNRSRRQPTKGETLHADDLTLDIATKIG